MFCILSPIFSSSCRQRRGRKCRLFSVSRRHSGAILPADTDPEQFALYVVNGGKVTLEGNESFHGVLYAPSSWVDIAGNTQVFGAVVASQTTMRDNAVVHYDVDLRKKGDTSDPVSGGKKKKK